MSSPSRCKPTMADGVASPLPQGRNTGKEIAEESDGGTVGRCAIGEGRLDYLQEGKAEGRHVEKTA